MSSENKFYDTSAALQLIGCTIVNPSLLEDEGIYYFNEGDFVNDLHKVIFGAAYNMYQMGSNHLSIRDIEEYLEKRPESYGIYKAQKGSEWLVNVIDNADVSNFDYYYNRLKKMSLLRGYDSIGMDVSWLYDPDNLLDIAKKKRQEDYLDSLSLQEIADLIDNRIMDIKNEYMENATDMAVSIGDGIEEYLEELLEEPDLGAPLYGTYMNTITRGARLGKFYIRSAATGVGKSRSMIADACHLACSEIYEKSTGEWIDIGNKEATLFISTELELNELQTMALAFIADVNEEHILSGVYEAGESERVRQAIRILKESKLYIEVIPDFSIKDIENIIKRNIRLNKTHYVFFDYMHSSMKILEEISRRSGGVKLREDNILFLFSVQLKDLCTRFEIFIMTGSQLNSDYRTSDSPDQNLLRGAKSIADWAKMD